MPDARNGSTRLHYEVSGSGPVLLLIPGMGVSVRDSRSLVEALSSHATVLAVDNRGVGLSDKPDEPYPMATLAADALAVLDAAGVDRANVLGYSLGGRIALQLTLDHPERVERLVLLATGARVISTRRRKLLVAAMPLLSIGSGGRQAAHALRRQREASDQYDARERLGEVGVPTLILHGRDDRIAVPALAEELHSGIAGARLEWYRGGHVAPMSSARTAVVDAVAGFVA